MTHGHKKVPVAEIPTRQEQKETVKENENKIGILKIEEEELHKKVYIGKKCSFLWQIFMQTLLLKIHFISHCGSSEVYCTLSQLNLENHRCEKYYYRLSQS